MKKSFRLRYTVRRTRPTSYSDDSKLPYFKFVHVFFLIILQINCTKQDKFSGF